MGRGIFSSPAVRGFNGFVAGLLNAPMVGSIMRRGFVKIRYVGRRSGKTFETPVNYRRAGDDIVINVMAPDAKTWWRNFLGDGGPITLVEFDGGDRAGHALANRDAKGRVTVTVTPS